VGKADEEVSSTKTNATTQLTYAYKALVSMAVQSMRVALKREIRKGH
jgi:hypothetical protein